MIVALTPAMTLMEWVKLRLQAVRVFFSDSSCPMANEMQPGSIAWQTATLLGPQIALAWFTPTRELSEIITQIVCTREAM